MPDTRGPNTPNGEAINTKIPLAMATIIPNKSSKPKVFSHLLLTRTRLLERLPKTPLSSSIITGETSENINRRITPGTINATNPRMISTPMMMLTTNRESTFVNVKLKAVCRFACPFSSISEVNFIVIPAVMLEVIQPTIPDIDKDVKVAATKVGNHANSCCDVGCTGAAGMTMADLTAIVTNPVKIPAAKNGIKY